MEATKSRRLRLLTVALVGTMLAACSTGGETTQPSASATGPTELSGSITVWSWDVAATALKRLAIDFQRLHANTEIDVVDVGYDNAYDKISVGLQAGSGLPDVVTIETDHMQPYINAFPNGFVDLTSRAAQYKDQFDPSKWAASTDAQGHLFSLPWDSGTVGLFYRRDYFEQAGLDPASIVTWDDYVKAGEQIKEKTGKAMLIVDVSGSDGIYAELLQQQGASYFTSDGEIAVAGPESVRAMTLLKTLYDKGLVDNEKGWDARVTATKEGKVATAPTGVWWTGTLTAEMPELSGKFGVMPLPVFDPGGSQTSNNGGSTLAIPSTSQNQDLAWAFIQFALADAKNQASMLENEGLFPAFLPAYQEPSMQAPQPYFGGQKVFQLFGELTPKIPSITYTADNSSASDLMTNTQAAILTKNQDPKAACLEAAQQLANATGREIAP